MAPVTKTGPGTSTGDFVIFTTTHAAGGERIRVRGWCCDVELL
jgi:hypothetical protein